MDAPSRSLPCMPCSGEKSAVSCADRLNSTAEGVPSASIPVWLVINPTRFPAKTARYSGNRSIPNFSRFSATASPQTIQTKKNNTAAVFSWRKWHTYVFIRGYNPNIFLIGNIIEYLRILLNRQSNFTGNMLNACFPPMEISNEMQYI